MSGTVSQEQIDDAKARDARFRAVALAVDVAAELRDSVALQSVMTAARHDAQEAMKEFAIVNPGDRLAVMALQARVYRLFALEQTFDFIDQQGNAAAAAIAGEDMREHDDDGY